MNQDKEPLSQLDQATCKRLARLSTVPVDTTRLERRLSEAMPAPAEPGRSGLRFRGWWRVASAAAAVVAITATLMFTLVGGPTPAVASPIELRQLHRDILAGRIELVSVTSIAQANREINTQQRDAPQIPGFDHIQVQSCCLRDIQGKLVAVVLLDYQGVPVTLVVARGRDFARPMGQSITIGSRTFMAHEVDGVQMVMSHEDDLWLCVMGDSSADDLAQVAAGVRLAD